MAQRVRPSHVLREFWPVSPRMISTFRVGRAQRRAREGKLVQNRVINKLELVLTEKDGLIRKVGKFFGIKGLTELGEIKTPVTRHQLQQKEGQHFHFKEERSQCSV